MNAYNEGSFYQAIPVFRKAVVPGESLDLDINLIFQTVPFTKNIQSGGIATAYAFYVPNRLVWSGWVDFIARDPDATAVPTASQAWPQIFENTSQARNVFMRRAYKLAYNQFFGNDDFGTNAYYANIETDTDVSMKYTRVTDQFAGKIMNNADIASSTYVAPVTGTSPNQIATVTLDDFRQSMANAYSKRRGRMTGDKYVDAMARMGVSLDWRVQNAPELIGTAKMEFYPKESKSSDLATLGQPIAYFREQMRLKTRRAFCAEHGVVFAVIVIRPHVFIDDAKGAMDQWQTSIDDFFLGDNQVGSDTYPSNYVSGSSDASVIRVPKFQYLLSGCNVIGRTSSSAKSWVARDAATSIDRLVYNEVTVPQLTGVLDNQFCVTASSVANSRTPVKSNVF